MWARGDMKIQIPQKLGLTRKLSGLEIKIAGVISYRNNAREGWAMGIEPTTTGTTIRGSTTELHPPSYVGGELRRCAGLYTQDCGMQDKFKFSHVFFHFGAVMWAL